MIGFEYFLVNVDYISGWKHWNLKIRPELGIVPPPTEEMKRSLYDQYGNLRFRFVEGKIVDDPPTPTEHQVSLTAITNTQLFKIIKAQNSEIMALRSLVGGEPAPQFTKLQNVIDKIQNGF